MVDEERVRGLWEEAREVSLGRGGEVERLQRAPSPLRFLREYVSANKPCLISREATLHWPAISQHSLWSDDAYLCRSLGPHRTVSVHLTPNGRADSLVPHPHHPRRLCFASPFVRSMEISEALRLIASTGSPTSPVVAYAQQQNDCFRTEYSMIGGDGGGLGLGLGLGLGGDVEEHIPWATEALGGCLPEAVNLWIGNARSQTSFHKDHYENLYVVITGEKHFLLFPPTELHRFYIRSYPAALYTSSSSSGSGSGEEFSLKLEVEKPAREVPWCSVDPYPPSPEEMERQLSSFPLYFDGPKPFQCTVRAGEILYLPSMWFHHVRQTPDRNGRTIAINYWYDMQFDIKYAYFNFLQSIDIVRPHSPDESSNSEDLSAHCCDDTKQLHVEDGPEHEDDESGPKMTSSRSQSA